jgi:hypothetical protein
MLISRLAGVLPAVLTSLRYHGGMAKKADPNRQLSYPLRWPAWLAEQVAEAANGRAMSMATWLRESALEKLERDKNKGEPGV